MENKGVHTGHRARLKNRVRKYGLESLAEHEILEFLLYPFIPRRDTNPIAHALLDTFGSLKNVLNRDEADLAAISGMTANAALYLHAVPDVFSAYVLSEKSAKMSGTAECAEYAIARIGRKKEEHFLTLYLSDACRVLKSEDVSAGKKGSVSIDRDNVVSTAVRCGAKYVVLAHNHPNGVLAPSDTDIDATNRIVQALGVVNVSLADHLIVSEDGYYSMNLHKDLVQPVDLSGSVYTFAESLIRREDEVTRLRLSKK